MGNLCTTPGTSNKSSRFKTQRMNKSERKAAEKTLLEAVESNNIPIVQDMLNTHGTRVYNDNEGHYIWIAAVLKDILERLSLEHHRRGNRQLVYEISEKTFQDYPALKPVFEYYVGLYRSVKTMSDGIEDRHFRRLLWEFETAPANDQWKHWFLNACHYKWQCEMMSNDPKNYWG